MYSEIQMEFFFVTQILPQQQPFCILSQHEVRYPRTVERLVGASPFFLLLDTCLFETLLIRDDVKLAQLVRARDCQSQGRQFDSCKTPKTENSNLHGFELHRPSSKGTALLVRVITINQSSIHVPFRSLVEPLPRSVADLFPSSCHTIPVLVHLLFC